MPRRSWLAVGLLLGAGLDALAGDPRRAHPVAAFGAAAARIEDRVWADSRMRGVMFAAACTGPVTLAALALQRLTRLSPAAQRGPGQRGPGQRHQAEPNNQAALASVLAAAVATWTVLGGASLAAEASSMARAIEAGDLEGARRRLPALCGRDARNLDAAELARATVESLAENTSDAVVAPLLWGAACGLPGLLGYRAVNTLDAMVGHHSPRYERFGWAAARLDDAANLLPARVTGLLAAALAPVVGGSTHRALRTMRRDGAAHPSPNGGRCEAAFAGALDVRLGGVNTYQGRVERRGTLGDGEPPAAADIVRAVRLSRLVGAAAAVLAAVMAYIRCTRRP